MKLVLGTVSFGIDKYSLLNANKPDISEVFKMLDYVYSKRVEFIDTASAYGNAEDILGLYGASKFKVTSKLKPNCLDGLVGRVSIHDMVKKELQQDLARLKLNKIWGYYFHTPKYIYSQYAVDSLLECKAEGLVEKVGVSIYEPKDAVYAASMKLDIIQVPYNILDQRLHKTDFFKIAKDNNVTVFGRQPFLKGLLVLPVDEIPPHLKLAIPYIQEIDRIRTRYDLTRQEIALGFSVLSDVDYVVFGVDNFTQLVEDTQIYTRYHWFEELKSIFQDISDYVVMPSLWEK